MEYKEHYVWFTFDGYAEIFRQAGYDVIEEQRKGEDIWESLKFTSALIESKTVNLPYTTSTYTFANKGASVIVTESEAEEFEKMSGFLVEKVETE